jgi:signal transduction histidine kinase
MLLDDLPAQALAQNARALSCDHGLVWLVHGGDRLECVASFIPDEPIYDRCLWIPEAESAALRVARTGEPLRLMLAERELSALHLPLKAPDGTQGVLSLFRRGASRAFSDADMAIANALLPLTSLLLGHAHAIQQQRQRAEQTAKVADITLQLSGPRSFSELLQLAADCMRETFAPDGIALVKLRRRAPVDCLEVTAVSFDEACWQRFAEEARAWCAPMALELFASLAVRTSPMILPDLHAVPFGSGTLADWTGAESAVMVPIFDNGQFMGTLNLFSSEPAAFDDLDIPLLSSVTERIASALLSTRLLEETRRRSREIESLFEAAQDIARRSQDVVGVLSRLALRIQSVLKGQSGAAILFNGSHETLPDVVTPPGQPALLSLRHGDGLEWLRELIRGAEPFPLPAKSNPFPDSDRTVVVPMLLDEQVVGTFLIGVLGDRPYDESERNLALSFAYLGALAVRNAGYFRRLEAEVSARTRALEEANQRLKILDQVRRNLLSNVTHELRTPLSGILGYGEILEEELADTLSGDQRLFMHEILAEGYHLRDLINTMLDMSAVASGTLELDRQPVSFELLARQGCEQFKPLAAAKDLEFACRIGPNLPFVHADPSRAYQVMGHLLTNAIKFTPAGGRVSLDVTVDWDAKRPCVRVEVTDSGIGIPAEKLPMLFSSFFQADATATRQFGGMGLGLSLSKRLIELHGGEIWARSVPGEGSTFGFTLPVWQDSDEVPSPS